MNEDTCNCYDIPTKQICGKPATRYMRVGEVIEHICEDCYNRDIIYPGAHPATQAKYEAYLKED